MDFGKHTNNDKISKSQKGISVIKKRYTILPRNALLTICKPFVLPHLDYDDIVYDQPNNQTEFFKQKVLYNAALAIKNAIEGTFRVKLNKELGTESLSFRR